MSDLRPISPEQRALYDAVNSGRIPLEEIVYRLFRIIQDKEEEISPEWNDVLPKIKSASLSPRLVDVVEKAVMSARRQDDEVALIKLQPSAAVTFLLGAGASAASGIPTISGLLPELWRKASKLGRDDIDRLQSWCEARRISNIEDLLTAASVSNYAAKNSAVSGLIDYFLFRDREDSRNRPPSERRAAQVSSVDASSVALFQETLQGLFGLLTGTMIPADPNAAHTAIADFVGKHKNCGIVTTNYDGCIDEALATAMVDFQSIIDQERDAISGSAFSLIKMHGSINWAYCDSCHHVKVFDLIDLKRGFLSDDRSYAVVGICKNCGGQRRPLLIPPTGLKFVQFPSLITLWNEARSRIESSDYIIVVGFSFSEADSYINRIIERSMSNKRAQVMIIIDPNVSLVPALRKRYAARIESFDEKRILGVRGSADKFLPEILHSLLDAKLDLERETEEEKVLDQRMISSVERQKVKSNRSTRRKPKKRSAKGRKAAE